jgi:CheY-like chemotaxis protein
VDDEIALCEMMSALLRHWGYQVECATSAIEALGIIRSLDCDMAIIDLLMPGMSGQELAPLIKQHARIPVIMISAFPPESLPHVDQIYSKPVPADKLRRIIESNLSPNSAEQKQVWPS